MNKKIFDIAYACFSLFLMLAFGIVVARAQQAQTRGGLSVFIPGFYKSPSGHTIEGRVVSLQNMPISGVTIRTNKGQSVVTDKNGEYAIEGLSFGSYTLTPSHSGIVFSPASTSVVVPPDGVKLNFTAAVLCNAAIVNDGIEEFTIPAGISPTHRRQLGTADPRLIPGSVPCVLKSPTRQVINPAIRPYGRW